MSVALMTGVVLGAGNTASNALLLTGDKLTLDFDLACSGGPSTVTFFVEFSEDNVTWYAEVDAVDAGKGLVAMAKIVRTLADNNATNIANNANFRVSCQLTCRAPLARVQMAVSAGACTVNSLTAPYGTAAQ